MSHGQGAWLVFRLNEFDDTYYRFGSSNGAYGVNYLQNDTVATAPVPIQTITNVTPQNGDVLRIRQTPEGTVECSVNGVVTHRFVDPVTNFRWTLNGMAANGAQAAFDDFKVTP
jgi:hypothetical protein